MPQAVNEWGQSGARSMRHLTHWSEQFPHNICSTRAGVSYFMKVWVSSACIVLVLALPSFGTEKFFFYFLSFEPVRSHRGEGFK